MRLDFEHSDYVDVSGERNLLRHEKESFHSEYTESTIWDLVDAPAVLVEDRSRIEFQIKIRSHSNPQPSNLLLLMLHQLIQEKTSLLHGGSYPSYHFDGLSQCDRFLSTNRFRYPLDFFIDFDEGLFKPFDLFQLPIRL